MVWKDYTGTGAETQMKLGHNQISNLINQCVRGHVIKSYEIFREAMYENKPQQNIFTPSNLGFIF